MAVTSFVEIRPFVWPPRREPESMPASQVRAPLPPPSAEEFDKICERLEKWIGRGKRAIRRTPAGPERESRLAQLEGILATNVRPAPFRTTAVDKEILEVLDGKALTTDALVCALPRIRDRKHVLDRLQKLKRLRLVSHLDGAGFYRPDRPAEWILRAIVP